MTATRSTTAIRSAWWKSSNRLRSLRSWRARSISWSNASDANPPSLVRLSDWNSSPQEVLGIGIARQPPGEVDRRQLPGRWHRGDVAAPPGSHLDVQPQDRSPRLEDGRHQHLVLVQQATDSAPANPERSRTSRARSGSNRSEMSGVWPCSAGGTMPPVATTMLIGRIAEIASRSTAWARARRRSTAEVWAFAGDRTRGNPTTPPVRARASGTSAGATSASRCVPHRHQVHLVAGERLDGRSDGCGDDLHPLDVAASRAGVVVTSPQHEAVGPGFVHAERPRHHLRSGLGPVAFVTNDRMAGLRAPVRTVHHAQEVRCGRHQPELHGAVVQRAHTDAVLLRGAQVSLLPVFQHEVHGDLDDPGASGSSTRLMPNSTSPAVSGVPSDQRRPSRRWKT